MYAPVVYFADIDGTFWAKVEAPYTNFIEIAFVYNC